VAGGRDDRDEPALVEAARGGDARVFEEILRRHESRVLRVLRLMGVRAQEREDVAQNVFLRLFRGLGGFRPGQPFGSWVYKVTVNAAHDWRAQAARLHRDEAPWDERGPERGRHGLSEDARLALAGRLEAALDLLTERERAAFVLVTLEEMDSEEAGRVLGISAVTVRRHAGLARERLRKALEEKKSPVG